LISEALNGSNASRASFARASGREIEGPAAIAILRELLTLTIPNLLVPPTLVLRYGLFDSTQKQNE